MIDTMRLLLDTHAFLWWRGQPDRLRETTKHAIKEAQVVFVSVASAWEIGIKQALGRLVLPGPVEEGVRDSGFEKLAITFAHAQRATALPMHHGDPFDRMLVAQAQAEELTLVTNDQQVRSYDVAILRA